MVDGTVAELGQQLPRTLTEPNEPASQSPQGPARKRALRRVIYLLLTCCLAATSAWFYWFRPIAPIAVQQPLLPRPAFAGQQLLLQTPGYVLTASAASYKDELFAYLMFDHLRYSPSLKGTRLMLTYDRSDTEKPYTLMVQGQEDLLQAIASVATLHAAGTLPDRDWQLQAASRVQGLMRQTDLFVSAYNLPVRKKLETIPRESIAKYLRGFIRFKSTTDPRIRLKLEPIPESLSRDDAQRLAADILTIADFYSLPLEFFLAIGAMENNYMNVRGDLTHSIWKRRPAPDDLVLERRRGRVRILNDSAGVWQITRETLRYCHKLFMRDERDYSELPKHLQPPDELKMNEVSPQVLTTYAGLLLRDLLDRFDGDVTLAVSAYNGGPGRPNLRYGAGVHNAAAHARRVLEQSAALNGESVVRMNWLRRP